jgi:hypothetical protein
VPPVVFCGSGRVAYWQGKKTVPCVVFLAADGEAHEFSTIAHVCGHTRQVRCGASSWKGPWGMHVCITGQVAQDTIAARAGARERKGHRMRARKEVLPSCTAVYEQLLLSLHVPPLLRAAGSGRAVPPDITH